MKKTAVFPGSFSPFTFGHLSIIERMLPLFDKIIVAIGVNSTKNNSYPTRFLANYERNMGALQYLVRPNLQNIPISVKLLISST